jgi:hypothetical protein
MRGGSYPNWAPLLKDRSNPRAGCSCVSVALRIFAEVPARQVTAMDWKTIRLELGASDGFPRGSAGRAFLLYVPIGVDGRIDRGALEHDPGRATVCRFWPSEPDSFGIIEPSDDLWALQCGRGPRHEATYLLDATPLRPNHSVQVRAPDGTKLAFRVANIRCSACYPSPR